MRVQIIENDIDLGAFLEENEDRMDELGLGHMFDVLGAGVEFDDGHEVHVVESDDGQLGLVEVRSDNHSVAIIGACDSADDGGLYSPYISGIEDEVHRDGRLFVNADGYGTPEDNGENLDYIGDDD